jgi:hypothetical protein
MEHVGRLEQQLASHPAYKPAGTLNLPEDLLR